MVASQHPFRFGQDQSPLKTSTELMFLLFRSYPQNQALIRFAHFIDSYSCLTAISSINSLRSFY